MTKVNRGSEEQFIRITLQLNFIYTSYLAESPIQRGVIWAGTDDGNIQVTLDGGKSH